MSSQSISLLEIDANLYQEAVQLVHQLRQQFKQVGVSKSQLGGLIQAADWAQEPEDIGKYIRHKKELAIRRSQDEEARTGHQRAAQGQSERSSPEAGAAEFWTQVEARLQKMRQEGKELAEISREGNVAGFGPAGSSAGEVQLWLYRRYLQHLVAEYLATTSSGR
ncbi:MAG: hypothetical protein H5U02_04295 [Clostridia bacterium]|nr:hypothetical protein [Clostridia bacterium]